MTAPAPAAQHQGQICTKNRRPSCSDLAGCNEVLANASMEYNWNLADAVEEEASPPKLPIESFNHIAREVLSLERSRQFYVDILGFREIPRPPFDTPGSWLEGYGIYMHLVATTVPDERRALKLDRILHFSSVHPMSDHLAFLTTDLCAVQQRLDEEGVHYQYQGLSSGIYQLLFLDPDGNALEVSNCTPVKDRQALGAERSDKTAAAIQRGSSAAVEDSHSNSPTSHNF